MSKPVWLRGLKSVYLWRCAVVWWSKPVWLRGLKCSPSLLICNRNCRSLCGFVDWNCNSFRYSLLDGSSKPMWLRGLKCFHILLLQAVSRSKPMWLRGLKYLSTQYCLLKYMSKPMWLRGLKLFYFDFERFVNPSRSLYGFMDWNLLQS